MDEDGNIYVADAENNRVQSFTSTGQLRSGWPVGGQGSGDQNLLTPIGVTWDKQNDVLLVADTSHDKIKAWNAAGVFRWTSPKLSDGDPNDAEAPEDVDGPRDVTRGPDGNLWVTAYEQFQIKVFAVGADGIWTGHLTPVSILGDDDIPAGVPR